MSKKGIAKVLAGVGVGVGLGMLFSPKSGKENRQELKKLLDELVEKVKGIDAEEVKEQVVEKVNEIKKELEDLDKEKALSIAKKKGEQLKKKADDLVKYAKDKGTPVIEGIAEDARQKTISVVKEVLAKLEKVD
jgi:gas vesicle protein